jgi:hypothetical protein
MMREKMNVEWRNTPIHVPWTGTEHVEECGEMIEWFWAGLIIRRVIDRLIVRLLWSCVNGELIMIMTMIMTMIMIVIVITVMVMIIGAAWTVERVPV